jgi:hypothetical protein
MEFYVLRLVDWLPNAVKQTNQPEHISYLVYEFYKTPFCSTRFLEHEERSDECYKANKCNKMAYKTSIIQYFFYFAP